MSEGRSRVRDIGGGDGGGGERYMGGGGGGGKREEGRKSGRDRGIGGIG